MEFLKAARKHTFSQLQQARFKSRGNQDNDYFSDRLSHRHTTRILIVFIVLSTFKRFFQSPITCWVPKELKRYEKYIDRYCWMKGTYYVNQNYDLNTLSIEARDETLLHYYQWVYFFLIFQAFLFYIPRVIWSFVSQSVFNYDLFNMVDAAIKHELYSYDQARCLKFLESHLVKEVDSSVAKMRQIRYLRKKINSRFSEDDQLIMNDANVITENDLSTIRAVTLRLSKTYLTLTYIGVKFLYLLLAVIQIYLMNAFLSTNAHDFYGNNLETRLIYTVNSRKMTKRKTKKDFD